MPGSERLRRVLHLIINGVIACIVTAAAAILVLLCCGIRPYVVLTGSMEPEIPVGSVCLVRSRIPFPEIRAGDIITFRDSSGAIVTHRAVRLEAGAVRTKGDANNTEDEDAVTEGSYLGKCVLAVPRLGRPIRFLRSRTGLLLFAGGILLLILADHRLDRRKPEQSEQERMNL